MAGSTAAVCVSNSSRRRAHLAAAPCLALLVLLAHCCAAGRWRRTPEMPRFIAQNVAGWLADKQYEVEEEFMQLHSQGLQRYTPDEIRAWPNNTIVYIKNDFVPEWARDVLPLVPHQVILILGNADTTPDKGAVQTILNSTKVPVILGINMPYLDHRIYHWPLGFNNMNRLTGDPAVLGYWYDMVYGKGIEHLTQLFVRKQNKVYLPGLGRTHGIRHEVAAWLESKGPGSELVEFNTKLSNGQSFSQYLELMSEYKFCLCPRGNGIDAHRVWECLLVGSVPIYVSNDPVPGALHAIQAEHYMTNMTNLAHVLHRVTSSMHTYLHTTFMWRARAFLTAGYHVDMLRTLVASL